jgi:hypothetical protein
MSIKCLRETDWLYSIAFSSTRHTCTAIGAWLEQSQKNLNANAANLRMTQITQRKFVKFAHLRYSRSKSANLSSDFATAIAIGAGVTDD